MSCTSICVSSKTVSQIVKILYQTGDINIVLSSVFLVDMLNKNILSWQKKTPAAKVHKEITKDYWGLCCRKKQGRIQAIFEIGNHFWVHKIGAQILIDHSHKKQKIVWKHGPNRAFFLLSWVPKTIRAQYMWACMKYKPKKYMEPQNSLL